MGSLKFHFSTHSFIHSYLLFPLSDAFCASGASPVLHGMTPLQSHQVPTGSTRCRHATAIHQHDVTSKGGQIAYRCLLQDTSALGSCTVAPILEAENALYLLQHLERGNLVESTRHIHTSTSIAWH